MPEPRQRYTRAHIPAALALLLIVLAMLLGGCGGNPLVGSGGVGVYTFSAGLDGCQIEASTLKGGPDAECTIDPDGRAHMRVSPSKGQAIDALLEFVKP